LSLAQMKQALATLSEVLDAAQNGIVIIDASGEILLYNRAALELLGDKGPSPVGRHFSEVRSDAWPGIQEVLATGRPQVGRRLEFGHVTIVANRSPIMLEGRVAGVISVFQDISAYEALISQLSGYQELSRELEAIIESSHDGLFIADHKADTIRVNSAYERVTGLKRQDLIGRNMRDLVAEGVFDHSVTLDVLREKRAKTIMQSIKGGKQVMVTGTPVLDGQGAISLVVTNVRDITELNRLRAQLAQSQALSSRYHQSLKEREQVEEARGDMVAASPAMEQVLARAVKAAASRTAILIQGESGVGKTMLARIIHRMSPRAKAPFVKISCGAIPEALMESELFGYRRGAFTGAAPEGKAGLVEAAHTGTVFLDEVGELTPGMQVKLLEVLEDGGFTRVGDVKPTSVDVRLIAATNQDLARLVEEKRFRGDLYYRLNVVPIRIPPLRQRPEDVPALALHVMRRLGRAKRLEPEVLDALAAYRFPGNVRELINLMERMAVMSEGKSITLADLPGELKPTPGLPWDPLAAGLSLKEATGRLEEEMIRAALKRLESPSKAARALGVHPTTLWRKLKRQERKLS